jgi:hypothetical protein
MSHLAHARTGEAAQLSIEGGASVLILRSDEVIVIGLMIAGLLWLDIWLRRQSE